MSLNYLIFFNASFLLIPINKHIKVVFFALNIAIFFKESAMDSKSWHPLQEHLRAFKPNIFRKPIVTNLTIFYALILFTSASSETSILRTVTSL